MFISPVIDLKYLCGPRQLRLIIKKPLKAL